MVARHAIKTSGNCSPLDSTVVLEATPSNMLPFRQSDTQPETEENTETHIPNLPSLSVFKEAVVGYIAGFVVRTAMKKIHCSTSLSALSVESSSQDKLGHTLIDMKSRGGLIRPSDSVLQVCKTAERYIQQHLLTSHIPELDSKFKARLSTQVLELNGGSAFKELEQHMFNLEPYNNHVFILIKYIANSYTNIRLHFLAKETSSASHCKWLCKTLGKLVLHKNQ
ncbi:hypothetical protein M9458_054041 [Cirrhinus mrigala]|uniref:DNA transposase THAP9 C-terminal domain-containing protein n=1 Tax=Cirrhinus mrigala TaxID=683832 RepID=A0ABD0MNU4_CIRMR